jgi:hypothetical protein
MNWVTLTYRSLKLKHSAKFLLIFSICSLTIAGVVWACAGGDDTPFSIFSPEAFVSKEYTPFFYDSNDWYYPGTRVEIEDNNNRFNDQVISEWDNYLNHQLSKPALEYLLLHSSKAGIDSVYSYLKGRISILKPDTIHINMGKLDKDKIDNLFNYLKLAKDCETFAVVAPRGWYDEPPPPPPVSLTLEKSLSSAFNTTKDKFIKERLWFQLTRYYFFNDDTTRDKKKSVDNQAEILVLYDKYKTKFPQNLTYYRTLGYIAGYYRRRGDYAQANYLYSRCYDYSFEMKIPSKFSFHAQQDTDWVATLKLAKNNEEKITLWHMLGMEYDEARAIKEIATLDPKSDKMDLLLSRLINIREDGGFYSPYSESPRDTLKENANALIEIKLIDSIALKNNTAKPYYWNIAAGYLHYINKDYAQAGRFYGMAKRQLPTSDKLIIAQYKMLSILLDLAELDHMDAREEAKLVEPLTWLANLKHGNDVSQLRFEPALELCTSFLANVYSKQGDTLKSGCFNDAIVHYENKAWVQKFVDLINKPNKTPFEKVMLMYYPHTLDDLYYHQATVLTYEEDIDKAIQLLSKVRNNFSETLPANPFNGRLNDCHDCDAAAPQKQKFTELTFLKTIQSIKTELATGKNKYRNALLLANAYYNISYYGNARQFYGYVISGGFDIYSQKVSKKYYLLARQYAQTNEQKAKCTFMASKCEHNEFYSQFDSSDNNETPMATGGKYFDELKKHYSQTKYYQEVLHECGYFKRYVNSAN